MQIQMVLEAQQQMQVDLQAARDQAIIVLPQVSIMRIKEREYTSPQMPITQLEEPEFLMEVVEETVIMLAVVAEEITLAVALVDQGGQLALHLQVELVDWI
jgi:hypothetical protein